MGAHATRCDHPYSYLATSLPMIFHGIEALGFVRLADVTCHAILLLEECPPYLAALLKASLLLRSKTEHLKNKIPLSSGVRVIVTRPYSCTLTGYNKSTGGTLLTSLEGST